MCALRVRVYRVYVPLAMPEHTWRYGDTHTHSHSHACELSVSIFMLLRVRNLTEQLMMSGRAETHARLP